MSSFQAKLEEGEIFPAQFSEGLAEVIKDLELANTCLSIEQKGTYKR